MLCRVLDTKKFSIIFLEGKGLSDRWNTLVEKLRALGVVPIGGLKENRILEFSLRKKGVLVVSLREKGDETRTYIDFVKSKLGRIGCSFG